MNTAPAELPPYCHLSPERSPDESAVIAVREMRISHPADALGLLWQLRKVAKSDEIECAECRCAGSAKKTQHRAIAQAYGLKIQKGISQ
jgi:hypothetical protein